MKYEAKYNRNKINETNSQNDPEKRAKIQITNVSNEKGCFNRNLNRQYKKNNRVINVCIT